MQNLPLAGLRIVSFEQFGSAPYMTMFLADLGAEVLKVETAEGDFARKTGPLTLGANDSLYFQSFNINKKSIFIDLKNADDLAFFHKLVGTCDAVVNNLRGNLPARLGLDYAALAPFNQAIVCGHISAYGRTTSRAHRPGYDFLMQAEAGLMALTGEPGSPPTRMGVSMIDYMSGMVMGLGLVSAIHAASRHGKGCDVDTSLYDVAIHQLAYQGTWRLNREEVVDRAPRSAHPSSTPVQLFKTQDGWIYIACMSDSFWQALCLSLDRPDITEQPRFSSLEARLSNRDALTEALDELIGQRTTAQWVAHLGDTVPAAPVYDLDEALVNPFLIDESGMVSEIAHRDAGMIRILSNPLRLNGERLPQRPGPALGEHTGALKGELG